MQSIFLRRGLRSSCRRGLFLFLHVEILAVVFNRIGYVLAEALHEVEYSLDERVLRGALRTSHLLVLCRLAHRSTLVIEVELASHNWPTLIC